MSGSARRIACINPNCNRTYEFDGAPEAVCNKCLKLCPAERSRYRALWRKITHARRYPHKWTPEKREQLYRLFDRNWERLKRRLAAPRRPLGLDDFLTEMDLI